MIINISFFLFSSSQLPSKKDTRKIYCRVRCGDKVRVFSMNRDVPAEYWDKKSGRISGFAYEASMVNGYLDMAEQSIRAICTRNPSVLEHRKTFRRLLHEEITKRQAGFYEAFLTFLEQKSRGCTLSTVRKWKSLLGLIEKFAAASGVTLTLPCIHASFLASFRSYLVHVCDQSDRTVTAYFSMLSSFLKWARKSGYLTEIPASEMHRLLSSAGNERNDQPQLSEDDLEKLREMVENNGAPEPEPVLLLTLCYTGLRAEEIRLLNRNSLSDAVLHIPGRKERNIYLSKNEEYIVRLFLSLLANGFYGRPHQAKLNEMLRTAARKAGLHRIVSRIRYKLGEPQVRESPLWELVTIEVARRSFLKRLKQKNLSLDKVLEMSGCTTPAALAKYF